MSSFVPDQTRGIVFLPSGNRDDRKLGEHFGKEFGGGVRQHECGVGRFQKIGRSQKMRNFDNFALIARRSGVDVEDGSVGVLPQFDRNFRVFEKLLTREFCLARNFAYFRGTSWI